MDTVRYDILGFFLLLVAGEGWSIARLARWRLRKINITRVQIVLTVVLLTTCLASCGALTLQSSVQRTEQCRATHKPAYYDGDVPHWNEPECHS